MAHRRKQIRAAVIRWPGEATTTVYATKPKHHVARIHVARHPTGPLAITIT